MPLLYFLDNIWFQGADDDFNALSLVASYCAGVAAGVETRLEGSLNKRIYFPVYPTWDNVYNFLYHFAIVFQELVPILGGEINS